MHQARGIIYNTMRCSQQISPLSCVLAVSLVFVPSEHNQTQENTTRPKRTKFTERKTQYVQGQQNRPPKHPPTSHDLALASEYATYAINTTSTWMEEGLSPTRREVVPSEEIHLPCQTIQATFLHTAHESKKKMQTMYATIVLTACSHSTRVHNSFFMTPVKPSADRLMTVGRCVSPDVY